MFSDKRRGDIWWMSDTHRKPADTCLIRGDGFCDNVLLLGYGEPSMALPRQVHGADRADLQQYLGHLTDADMRRLDAALRSALGL